MSVCQLAALHRNDFAAVAGALPAVGTLSCNALGDSPQRNEAVEALIFKMQH
jgi:hypothetical protein